MINTKVSEKLKREGFMTAKIIQHGRLRECVCFNCRCIFSFEEENIEKESVYTPGCTTYVKCPECGERNVISL